MCPDRFLRSGPGGGPRGSGSCPPCRYRAGDAAAALLAALFLPFGGASAGMRAEPRRSPAWSWGRGVTGRGRAAGDPPGLLGRLFGKGLEGKQRLQRGGEHWVRNWPRRAREAEGTGEFSTALAFTPYLGVLGGGSKGLWGLRRPRETAGVPGGNRAPGFVVPEFQS